MVRHPQVEDLLWLIDLESRVVIHTYEGNLVVAGVHSGGQPFTVQQTRVLVWTRGAVTIRGPQPVTYFLFKVCCLSRVPSDERKYSKYKSGDILDSDHSNIWTWISRCPKQDTPKHSPAFLHLQLLMQFCAQTLEAPHPLHPVYRGPVSCLLSLWSQSASTTLVDPCGCQHSLPHPLYYQNLFIALPASVLGLPAHSSPKQPHQSWVMLVLLAKPWRLPVSVTAAVLTLTLSVKPFMFDPCCFSNGYSALFCVIVFLCTLVSWLYKCL